MTGLGATYYRDKLEAVNAAITQVERNQSYQIEGRMLNRAKAQELYMERARLEPLALQEARRNAGTSTGGFIRITSKKGT